MMMKTMMRAETLATMTTGSAHDNDLFQPLVWEEICPRAHQLWVRSFVFGQTAERKMMIQ